MKGFARILEAIIASIIILTSLTFFLTVSVKQSNWDSALSEIRAEDAISAGYKTGLMPSFVRSNDNTSLRNLLEGLFSKSTDFSVEIVGMPNPVIFVGCSCSDAQANDISTRLAPLNFTYKGRPIEMRIQRISVTNVPDETNIILFMTYDDLNNAYNTANGKNSIEQFMESGGTLFLIGDLTQGQANSEVIKNIFNLTWSGDSGINAVGKFSDPYNSTNIAYNIAKYYENITGKSAENENFDQFNTNGDTINKISVDNTTVIQTSNKKFSLVKGRKSIINGNGRALWFAENSNSGQVNNLTKTAIMWASGERYKMDGAIKKIPSQTSQRASLIIHDTENYEFRITTWNVF